jgi:uncharacterized protein YjbI with pentapeptide repeats
MQAGKLLPLTRGCFRGASIPSRQYNGVDLHQTDLTGSDLYGSHLYGVNLRLAKLDGANLSTVLLDKAGMDGATACFDWNLAVPALEDRPVATQFAAVEMRNVIARGVRFVGATFNSLSEPDKKSDLFQADFRGALLAFADFRGVKLDQARLDGADLSDANFTGASVDNISTVDAIFCRTKWIDGSERSDGCSKAQRIPKSKMCSPPTAEELEAVLLRYK